MKKTFTYLAVIAASVGLFFYLFTTQVQATNLFLSTVGTSTFPGGINMGTGCFAINNVCLTSGSSPTGSTGQVAYFSGTNTAVGTSTIFVTAASRVGIGTTTPLRAFVVEGPNTSGGVMLIQRDTGSTNTASLFTALRAHAYTTAATYAAGYGTSISFDISTSTATNNFMGLVGAYRSATNDYSGILEIGANTGGVGTQYFQLIDGSNGVYSFATSTVSVDSYAFQNAGNITNAFSFYSNTGAPLLRLSNTGVLSLNGVQIPKFGGTGADGALTLTSGTTTIALGSATYFEKDYTSISITGTGHLAFSGANTAGTFIVLRSQGGVTLTCNGDCIDVSGLGSAGGAASATCGGTTNANGGNATVPNTYYLYKTGAATGGTGNGPAGAAGTIPTTITPVAYPSASSTLMKYGGQFWVGAGGGGGACTSVGSGTATSGAGGAGGGGLLLETGSVLNLTATNAVYAAGITGGTGTGSNSSNGAAGGGGGSGGFVKIYYNTLTANSGTVSVAHGTGGLNSSSGVTFGNPLGGGGGGATPYTAGNAGTLTNTNAAQSGGNGADGYSSVEKNNDY